MQGYSGSTLIQKSIVRLLMEIVRIFTASNLEPQQYLKQSLARRALQKETTNRLSIVIHLSNTC